MADHGLLEFSLYALAIIHCYSILENNRALLLSEKIPVLSPKVRGRLHDIRCIDLALRTIGIDHRKIRCYKTMEEFRIVNNAIKHGRFGLSNDVVVKGIKRYAAKQLRSMYHNRAALLENYLSSLYEKVTGMAAPRLTVQRPFPASPASA